MKTWPEVQDSTVVLFGHAMEGATGDSEVTYSDISMKNHTDKIVNGLKKMVVYESKSAVKSFENVTNVVRDTLTSSSEVCSGTDTSGSGTGCDETVTEIMYCSDSSHFHDPVKGVTENSNTKYVNKAVHPEAVGESEESCIESSCLPPLKHSTLSENATASSPSNAFPPATSAELSTCNTEERIDAPCSNSCDNSVLPKSSSVNVSTAELTESSLYSEPERCVAESKSTEDKGSNNILSDKVTVAGHPERPCEADDNDSTEISKETKLVNGKPVSLLKTDFAVCDQNDESSICDMKDSDSQESNDHSNELLDKTVSTDGQETSNEKKSQSVDVDDCRIFAGQNLTEEVSNGSCSAKNLEENVELLNGQADSALENNEESGDSDINSIRIETCTTSVSPHVQDKGSVTDSNQDTTNDHEMNQANEVEAEDTTVDNDIQSEVLTEDEGKARIDPDLNEMESSDMSNEKPSIEMEKHVCKDTNQKHTDDELLQADVKVRTEDTEIVVITNTVDAVVDEKVMNVCSDDNKLDKSTEQIVESKNDNEVVTPENTDTEKVRGETIQESEDVFSGQPMQCEMDDDDNLDDEILLIDETEVNDPVNYSDQKYSFKNILQKPLPAKVATDSSVHKETKHLNYSQDIRHQDTSSSSITETKKDIIEQISVPEEKINLESQEGGKKYDLESKEAVEGGKKRSLSIEEQAAPASKRSKVDSSSGQSDEDVKEISVDEKLDDATNKKVVPDAPEVAELDDVVIVTDDQPGTSAAQPGTKTTDKEEDSKPLQLTFEALQAVIAARVKVFVASHKQTYLEKLNRRTRGMQSATNLWKETAKHLEKSVLELTVLNQKLEKRKAHASAVKSLASRTIGIQVNEEKVKSVIASVSANNQPRRQEPVNSSAALKLPPSVLLNQPPTQPPQQTFRQQIPPGIRNRTALHNAANTGLPQSPLRPPQNRIVRAPVRPPAPSIPSASPQRHNMRVPQAQQQNIRAPVAQMVADHVVNLIDLTDEEDTARKAVTPAPRSAPSQLQQTVSKLPAGGKVASSPSNGFIQQSSVPAATSGVVKKSSLQQPTVPGSQSQLMAPGNATMGMPGSQYQLVSINNATTAHTGAFIALVPGTRATGPSTMSATSVGPASIPASPKVIPPTPSTAGGTTTLPATKPVQQSLPPSFHISQSKHPAPLPSSVDSVNAPSAAKSRPPKPGLKISRVTQGIVLSWNMPSLADCEKIASYQLFAYQETDSAIPRSTLWKKVGDVKALPLPMACTLTQFQEGNKYHFAVRAVDQYGRWGAYSDPSTIFLGPKT